MNASEVCIGGDCRSGWPSNVSDFYGACIDTVNFRVLQPPKEGGCDDDGDTYVDCTAFREPSPYRDLNDRVKDGSPCFWSDCDDGGDTNDWCKPPPRRTSFTTNGNIEDSVGDNSSVYWQWCISHNTDYDPDGDTPNDGTDDASCVCAYEFGPGWHFCSPGEIAKCAGDPACRRVITIIGWICYGGLRITSPEGWINGGRISRFSVDRCQHGYRVPSEGYSVRYWPWTCDANVCSDGHPYGLSTNGYKEIQVNYMCGVSYVDTTCDTVLPIWCCPP